MRNKKKHYSYILITSDELHNIVFKTMLQTPKITECESGAYAVDMGRKWLEKHNIPFEKWCDYEVWEVNGSNCENYYKEDNKIFYQHHHLVLEELEEIECLSDEKMIYALLPKKEADKHFSKLFPLDKYFREEKWARKIGAVIKGLLGAEMVHSFYSYYFKTIIFAISDNDKINTTELEKYGFRILPKGANVGEALKNCK